MNILVKIIIVFFFSLHIPVHATQTIQLGFEDINFYPIYGTYDANDNKLLEYDGYSADVFKLFNKSQKKFELIFNPIQIKRLYLEYLSPESALDAKYPDDPNWAQELKEKAKVKIHYSTPILKYTDGTFVLNENNNFKIENIKKLGIILGFSPVGYEEQIKDGRTKLVETINVKELFNMLIEKKVDGIYISKYIGICKLNVMKLDQRIVFNSELPSLTGYYRLSSKKYPELISLFNYFLRKNKRYLVNMEKNILKFKCH